MRIEEKQFDALAEQELTALEKRLGDFDPDEVEVELSMGVLTLTLGDGGKVVINSHRAAGQIWMAAFRKAWHFDPTSEPDPGSNGKRWRFRTAKD